ncbi:MAG: hypothetical protein JWO63_283 [Frankiales bacterium]|jgi:hypothetical protein|nr:hypothetical protein [Frankiales bacterium]
MTDARASLDLNEGLTRSGMTYSELWLRQIAVGGVADELSVEAYLLGLLEPDHYMHDVLAQAINEYFLEHDVDEPVSYWGP